MDPDNYLPENFFQMLIRKFPERNIALELAGTAPLFYFGTPGRLLLRASDAQIMLELFVAHCDLLADRLEITAVPGSMETFFRGSGQLSS